MRHLARVVDHLAAVAQREMLERLLGERVTRSGRADEPGHLGGVQRLGRRHDVGVRLRWLADPPSRTGPCGSRAAATRRPSGPRAAPHRRRVSSSALAENVSAPSVSITACGRLGVEQVVGRQRADRGERLRADHVGQLAGGGGRGQQLVELVLVDADELDLDSGRLGELGDDLLRLGHPVRDGVAGPDHDLVVLATATSLLLEPSTTGRQAEQDKNRCERRSARRVKVNIRCSFAQVQVLLVTLVVALAWVDGASRRDDTNLAYGRRTTYAHLSQIYD